MSGTLKKAGVLILVVLACCFSFIMVLIYRQAERVDERNLREINYLFDTLPKCKTPLEQQLAVSALRLHMDNEPTRVMSHACKEDGTLTDWERIDQGPIKMPVFVQFKLTDPKQTREVIVGFTDQIAYGWTFRSGKY